MTEPRVTVVIPTYNQADLLALALRSVIDQTVTDWRAIVINNYSDDDTISVVEGCADPRITLVNFRNHGVIAASRNQGIRAADTDWIAFLDSDDLWTPDKLERCLAATGDDVDLVSHPESIVRDGRRVGTTETATPRRTTYRRLLFDGNCLSPTAVLVRKSCLDAVGGFCEDADLATAEDYDLWLRLAQRDARCRTVEAVLSQFTLHEGSASTSLVRHLNAGLAVLDRHFGRLEPKRPFDAWRHRRSRARLIYSAARGYAANGMTWQSLKTFAVAARTFPFIARIYAGVLLALVPRRSLR